MKVYVIGRDFSVMNYAERMGYLYILILAFKEQAIEILNDPTLPNIAKFLYCFVIAEGLAKTFNFVRVLREMGTVFR